MQQLKVVTGLMLVAGLLTGASAMAQQAAAPVATQSAVAQPLQANQTALIEQTVRTYLLAHPEILMEMSQKLQAKQQQEMMDKAAKVIVANVQQLAHDPASPVTGNALGKVTVVEFFDYQCPHCKAMVSIMDGLMLANKDLRIVYKEMPIFGAESEFAARAALAANKQGKYQALNHALLKAEGRLSNQQVLDIAKSIGLDINKLQAVMNSAEITKELQSTSQMAQQLGLPGTPAFIVLTEKAGKVDFRFIPGQTDQNALQQAINAVTGVASTKPVAVK
jgi:protein-disulfide isomerase